MRVDKLVRLPSSSARPLTPPHRGSEANQRDHPGAGADGAHHWHAPTSKNMSDDHRTGRLCADAARLARRHFVRKSMRPRMSLRGLGMQPRQPLVNLWSAAAACCYIGRGIFQRASLHLSPREYVCSDSYAASSWNKQPTSLVTDASCKLRHKRTRDHARRRPHRNALPSAGYPFGAHRQYVMLRTSCPSGPPPRTVRNAARRRSIHCHCPCNVPLCPASRVQTTASTRSSHHGTMSNDTSQLPMRCAMSATRDDTSSLTSSMSEA